MYNVYDSYIYSVEGDRIKSSYYVDKGKHLALLDFELWLKDKEKANQEAGLNCIMVNENRKYVMGSLKNGIIILYMINQMERLVIMFR